MERLNLNRDTNLIEISVNKYDDLLILDCGDLRVFEKFTALSGKIDSIAAESSAELKRIDGKYAGEQTDQKADQVDIELVKEYVNINIAFSKRMLTELDDVFGAGFTDKVFRENYELNPDYVPSELAIVELIESLVPVVEGAYNKRIKRNKTKYNAAKKGKHTKSKDELIEEYKEKHMHE